MHDEHGAQLGAQLADELTNERAFFGSNDRGFGVFCGARWIWWCYGGKWFDAMAGEAAIIGGALNGNDEKPRARFASGIEILNSGERNGKNFLGDVVGVARGNAMTFDGASDKLAVLGIEADEYSTFVL